MTSMEHLALKTMNTARLFDLSQSSGYHSYIDECAANSIDSPIRNGHPEHAVYLMRKLFDYAMWEILLFTGSLHRDTSQSDGHGQMLASSVPHAKVYGDPDLVDAAIGFLSRSDGKAKLKILAQYSIDNSPTHRFF